MENKLFVKCRSSRLGKTSDPKVWILKKKTLDIGKQRKLGASAHCSLVPSASATFIVRISRNRGGGGGAVGKIIFIHVIPTGRVKPKSRVRYS